MGQEQNDSGVQGEGAETSGARQDHGRPHERRLLPLSGLVQLLVDREAARIPHGPETAVTVSILHKRREFYQNLAAAHGVDTREGNRETSRQIAVRGGYARRLARIHAVTE